MINELDIILESLGESITEKPYYFKSKTNKWYSIKVGNKTLVKVDIAKCVTIIDSINNKNLTFKTSDSLTVIKNNINVIIESYFHYMRESDGDKFGCCSSYLECSNKKICVKNDNFSRNCYYRKNLELGKIFYGKNRNIDKKKLHNLQ